MRHIGNTLFILAAASTAAAIWSPIGAWCQWLASAALLFLAGAYAHGTALGRDITATPSGIEPTSLEDPDWRGDNPRPLADQHPTGNATGPHLHHDTTGATHTNPRNNYGTPA